MSKIQLKLNLNQVDFELSFNIRRERQYQANTLITNSELPTFRQKEVPEIDLEKFSQNIINLVQYKQIQFKRWAFSQIIGDYYKSKRNELQLQGKFNVNMKQLIFRLWSSLYSYEKRQIKKAKASKCFRHWFQLFILKSSERNREQKILEFLKKNNKNHTPKGSLTGQKVEKKQALKPQHVKAFTTSFSSIRSSTKKQASVAPSARERFDGGQLKFLRKYFQLLKIYVQKQQVFRLRYYFHKWFKMHQLRKKNLLQQLEVADSIFKVTNQQRKSFRQ